MFVILSLLSSTCGWRGESSFDRLLQVPTSEVFRINTNQIPGCCYHSIYGPPEPMACRSTTRDESFMSLTNLVTSHCRRDTTASQRLDSKEDRRSAPPVRQIPGPTHSSSKDCRRTPRKDTGALRSLLPPRSRIPRISPGPGSSRQTSGNLQSASRSPERARNRSDSHVAN